MSQTNPPDVLQAAAEYLRRGWQPVPIPPRRKRPVLADWPNLRMCEGDLAQHFRPRANIGLILGEPSRWLVNVDLDCAEARELAEQFLPSTPAVTGRTSTPASHRWYVAEGAATLQHRDPVTRAMIVELRSTGAQTLVGPSLHPSGEPYTLLTGEPAHVSAEVLTASVVALANAVVKQRHGDRWPARSASNQGVVCTPPSGSSADVERRAIAYLESLPPAISGQGGHATTYAAATAVAHGFGIEPDQALRLLLEHYNPRCEPPWSEKELRHKVDDAANKPHDRPFGWLRDAPRDAPPESDVDISALVHSLNDTSDGAAPFHELVDPGPLPASLLRVPGFVAEVMDHCLATAPYPNTVMSFCGALALQAFLAGRKVRDQADNRTNIYLLCLAHSSAGKDWPRKINTQVLYEVGLHGSLGDRFSSGEGLQDSLHRSPCLLYQSDEVDTMLQSINKAKDSRYESVMATLLTMYSSANSVFPMRHKAGQETAGAIDQPCLVLFGTAIPNHYYAALSERMLTNGFFARMLILECPRRGAGQEPRLSELPARVIETAKWWVEFQPGRGNLQHWHPVPAVVEYTPEAQEILIAGRQQAEAEYTQAEDRGDPVATTVWGRANEQSRKLALLYAVSANPREPRIDRDAAEWATQFVTHQTHRMLFMAHSHVADNPFHADCLRFIRKLRDAADRTLPHSVLLKRMKVDAQTFQKLVQTLLQQGDIESCHLPTAGRTGLAYRLLVP